MVLYKEQVRKYLNNKTGMDVEKKAVEDFIKHIETEMEHIAEMCIEEHSNHTFMREKIGLYCKKRLDQSCMKKAIKNLNKGKDISPISGGIYQKEGNNLDKAYESNII